MTGYEYEYEQLLSNEDSQNDYQVPPEYVSPTLTPPSNKAYTYARECRRGYDTNSSALKPVNDMSMGYLLICGSCGWLIDTCESYWVSKLDHKCHHTCCLADSKPNLAKT